MKKYLLLVVAFVTLASCKTTTEDTNFDTYMVVGTYTTSEDEGINVFKFNTETGEHKYISTKKGVENPSFITPSKDGNFIYAVSENSLETAKVSSFSFDKKNGTLSFINEQKTKGADPCHLSIDLKGEKLVVANYSGASAISYPIKEDGSLDNSDGFIAFVGVGKDSVRQTQPHIHHAYFTPDSSYVLINDLGLDKIYSFSLENQESFLDAVPNSTSVTAGYGPRHLEFHPNNKWVYLLSEISGMVTVFDYSEGKLTEKQNILADTLNMQGSGDIHVSPDGKFVYASNRLEGDGIAIFSVNQTDGTLAKVGYQETGKHPRNFAITPNGKLLLSANRDSNSIQVFSIDNTSGLLTDLNKNIELGKPVCIKFIAINN